MIKNKNYLQTILEVVAHWSHRNPDALCGSKSGLVFLDWCDGEGEGNRVSNCLMPGIFPSFLLSVHPPLLQMFKYSDTIWSHLQNVIENV